MKSSLNKRMLSELFSGSTELETVWKLSKAIYSTKEFILPLEMHTGAEMCLISC